MWGWGPGHWSALRPPATPSMLSSPGRAALAGPEASPRVFAGPLQSLHPLCPGLGDLGPWSYPASEGTGLAGRPAQPSGCFSTGRSGVPTSWRPCLGPWPSWSWGLWSASPGAPPWTSLRTLGVGTGPLSQEGAHGAWTPGLPGRLPLARAYGSLTIYVLLLVTYCNSVGTRPLLRAAAGGGEVPELEDPGGHQGRESRPGRAAGAPQLGSRAAGAGGSSGQFWASGLDSASTIQAGWWDESFWNIHVQDPGHVPFLFSSFRVRK